MTDVWPPHSLPVGQRLFFLWPGPPTVSVLPEGPVRVKVGKDVVLECISAGEPHSSARWTRIGTPAKLEPRTIGHVDSHAVLKVRSGPVHLWA